MTKLIKPKETVNELLDEEFKPRESIYNGRWTKTALFLLPMLDIEMIKTVSGKLSPAVVQKYLYNAFLDDKEFEHEFSRCIFMLIKTVSFQEKGYRDLMAALGHYRIYDYDLGVQNGFKLVMVVCQVPEKYEKDFYHFRAGRYSQMSPDYKKRFGKFTINAQGEKVESIVWGAMNKSDVLKDRVAKMFCVKDDDGEIKSQSTYQEFRDYIDTLDEIWERPRAESEYYRFKPETNA